MIETNKSPRPKRTVQTPKRFVQHSHAPHDYNTAEIVHALVNTAFIPPHEIQANRASLNPDEPPIEEALASDKAANWWAAIEEERQSLYAMDVVEECERVPSGRKAIKSRWVLRRKRNELGHIARYKARLVAKGFSQKFGLDFFFTFAPVAKWDSIRLVMCIATILDLELHHLDVKTAYLNGILEEEIYLEIPPELGKGFWRLKKGLYGLRQAGRQWYIRIHTVYVKLGYKRCNSDWSVYWRRRANNLVIIAMSVDDLAMAASSKEERDLAIKELSIHFELSDQGEAHWLLSCRITRNREARTLKLDQEQYTTTILEACKSLQLDLTKCSGVNAPMESNKRLTSAMSPQNDEERELMKTEPYCHYREIVGKLMYLVTCSRPDIAFPVRECAKFMSNYGKEHFMALKRILRYLAKTKGLGVVYSADKGSTSINFRAFSDSDWAQAEGRKSVSGYVIEMANGPIAWSSKQQAVVALSSCEAEYLSTTHAAKQILWTRSILSELGYRILSETVLYCDNQGTVHCTHDPMNHSAMKHIDIRIHFIRDCVTKKLILVLYIPGNENLSDILTKPLGPQIHSKWVFGLGMR